MNASTSRFTSRREQRGVVLFVALIVLIVMTLAGLALLRQMGVGTSIAGNIAFKENATYTADRGAEAAVQYLDPARIPPADLSNDNFAAGYVATWNDGLDTVALPWGNALVLLDDSVYPTGNNANVLIQRLCLNTGSSLAPTQRCSDVPVANPFRSHGNTGSLAGLPSTTPFPFYRVTTRVLGPRNTVSYTQVLMQ